jgi:hypothetical protein
MVFSSSVRLAAKAAMTCACWLMASQAAQAQTVPRRFVIAAEFGAPAVGVTGMPVALSPSGAAAGYGSALDGSTTRLLFSGGKLTFVKVPVTHIAAMAWTNTGKGTVLKPWVTKGYAKAFNVNDAGWAVGIARKSVYSLDDYAVLWRNGLPTDLGAGLWSEANYVNTAGVVLGMRHVNLKDVNGQTYASRQPFLWTNGKLQTLSAFPAKVLSMDCVGLSEASTIPCNAEVLQQGSNYATTTKGYLWRNGVYEAFDYPGASRTLASGMTPGGAVYGYAYFNGINSDPRFFVWRNEQFSLMPSDLDYIYGMNDAGLLVVSRLTGVIRPDGVAETVPEIRSLSGDVLSIEQGIPLTTGEALKGYFCSINNRSQLMCQVPNVVGGVSGARYLLFAPAP